MILHYTPPNTSPLITHQFSTGKRSPSACNLESSRVRDILPKTDGFAYCMNVPAVVHGIYSIYTNRTGK